MSDLFYSQTPYERLFKDIMSEFEYTNLLSDKYSSHSSKEEYVIEMPLVGITKEELSIKAEDKCLSVETKPAKTTKFVKNTSIKFSLKEDADTINVSAKLENGLLTIKIPRNVPEKRSIDVKIN